MRSDYALYGVAIIFFILTGIVLAYQVELKELWVVTTAVLGLLFVGLGCSQRPKLMVTTIKAPSPSQVIKEKEVIREVVMIPCKYCGALMPQTAIVCPYCGAKRTP